ncbi:MAG TPA: oxidoreductase [Rhizomicrobium sp.]|jgi:NAD(P)-dependent dehydrogenase (short-subunit alcohol dehydrogenase family)
MKRWMITGIGSGLGAALAQAALDRGDVVAGSARDEAVLKSFEAEAPGRAFGFKLDIRDEAQVIAVVKVVDERTGGIDVLVNNAGYGLVSAVEEATAAEVRDQFEVNVFGQLAVLRAVLPFMRKRRAGHIVNVTSVSGLATWAGTGIYCASKFAFEAIGQTLAQEVAELGIKVTNAAPGGMRTDYAGRSLVLSKNRIADYDGRARQAEHILADHAGKESGDPVRVAAAILKAVDSENPPLHLLLGADALHYAGDQFEAIQKEIEAWKPVSLSTAYPD